MKPDVYPAGTPVMFSVSYAADKQYLLGPQSKKLFLDMLARPPVHSQISSMPAAPMGSFIVAGNTYQWHGNGVIHGTGEDERLWQGKFLQRLIKDVMYESMPTGKKLAALLDAVERDPSIAATPMEGPGAYPGGGDALHPVTEFKKFEPKPK